MGRRESISPIIVYCYSRLTDTDYDTLVTKLRSEGLIVRKIKYAGIEKVNTYVEIDGDKCFIELSRLTGLSITMVGKLNRMREAIRDGKEIMFTKRRGIVKATPEGFYQVRL